VRPQPPPGAARGRQCGLMQQQQHRAARANLLIGVSCVIRTDRRRKRRAAPAGAALWWCGPPPVRNSHARRGTYPADDHHWGGLRPTLLMPGARSRAARLRGPRRGRLLDDAGAVGLLLLRVCVGRRGASFQHRCRRRTDSCLLPVEAATPRSVSDVSTPHHRRRSRCTPVLSFVPWAIHRFSRPVRHRRPALFFMLSSMLTWENVYALANGQQRDHSCFLLLLIRITKYSLVKAIFGWIPFVRLGVGLCYFKIAHRRHCKLIKDLRCFCSGLSCFV